MGAVLDCMEAVTVALRTSVVTSFGWKSHLCAEIATESARSIPA